MGASKLVLRMAPASVPTVLRDWDEHDDRFDVVLDDSLTEHLVQFMTEEEWNTGAINLNPRRTDDVGRWIDFDGYPLCDIDIEDMHTILQGRDPVCERMPYVCERLP
jgi:hypothetical protein